MKNPKIAIIGIACRFPGAKNYHEFWHNLIQSINSIQEIPPERWNLDQYYSPIIDEPNKSISKWCGLLDQINQFDNNFFNISPREAKQMDPQQRLLLEETWHCIEDSGLSLTTLQTKKTAVYVGVMANDYLMEIGSSNVITDSYAASGNYNCILANRISYLFGFQGTSLSVDAACAASMVALHNAKVSLLSGESDYAIAAGVSLNFHPWKYISFSKSRMLSPDGQCKTFDKEANGYVPGEGVGVLLLQPLNDALRDRNHIYGLIKGSAVNHGGQTPSLTAPRVEAQRDVILAAYKEADISPETVTYVEAHGTGTSLGDPIEIEALTRAFREYTDQCHYCEIGSVKTNIGHLEAAAGIASVIKVLLMMRHQQIPPTLNLKTLNPVINFTESPFVVATQLKNWSNNTPDSPLRAGVSSFGFGGVNSHVILESFSPSHSADQQQKTKPDLAYPFILSAQSPNALKNTLEEWKNFLDNQAYFESHLADICATLTGRRHFPYRYGSYVKNKNELTAFLQQELPSITKPTTYEWYLHIGELRWDDFASIQALLEQEPLIKKHLITIEQCLSRLDIPSEIKEGFHSTASWTASTQPLYSFIVNYAYLSSLIELGFAPNLVTGEKAGLWLCLTLSGMVTLEDTLAVLSNQKTLEQIVLARPHLPFYDPVTHHTHLAYHFDQDYLHFLVSDLNIFTDDLHHFIEKALLLKESQFTFKKYLDEWAVILRQHTGITLDSMLQDNKLLHSQEESYKKEKILLMLIIKSALRQLDKKWDLTRQRRIKEQKFQELLDLVIDGVMPKETVIELFVSGEIPDLANMATLLNKRQDHLDTNKPYPFLTEHSQKHQVIAGNINIWFQKATAPEMTVPALQHLNCLEFGQSHRQTISNSSIQITLTDKSDNAFKETLLQLWLAGVNIKWDILYPDGHFNKVPLPTYGFERSAFWLTKAEKETTLIQPMFTNFTNNQQISEQPFYYLPVWREEPLYSSLSPVDDTISVIIFSDHHGVGAALSKQFLQPIIINAGEQYTQINKNTYEINILAEQDYHQILAHFASVQKIYFLWGIANNEVITNLEDFEVYENKTVMSLFRLCKVLSEHQAPLELTIVTSHLHHVVANDVPLFPYAAPLLGLAKVLELENPSIQVRCVDIELNEMASSLALLIQEKVPVPFFKEIAYRDGKRYIKTIEAQPTLLPSDQNITFKQKGVYLIIGGMGGIGFALTRFLAENFQARLILVGRSALNQHKQEQLKALQNLGSEVLYLTADISHWDDMSRVIQTTKEKFGNLQGVIHSALVMASGLIKNMNEGIFKQALEPKFKGSFILNQLLSKEKLDFLLFFSSIITFRGDKGGSNYAAGCAFQDAYTHFLRTAYQRPSITINWGRWGEVGVTANARFKKVKGLDIDVLQTQEGIQALQTVITSGTPRIIIAKLGEEWLNSDKQISNENTFVNQIITQKIETEILQQQLNQGLELGMIEVEQYAQLLLLNAFQSMQLLQQEGESYTKSQLKAQIGLLEKYDRLFEVLLEILERNGIVQLKNTHIIVTDKITQPELQHRLSHISTERAALLHAFPDKQAHVNLLDAGLTSLQDILTGQIKATERLFPDSSLSLVERFYQENRFADYYNHLVAKYIQYEIETRLNQSGEQQPVRILELGAGTGGTSVKVLEQIAVHGSKVDYCYTDISMAFVKYGKQQLGPTYPFMRFSLLNIEEVSEQKRTELGKFDIIFATNVVHATKNLSHTFSEIKQLLKPQGCLLLNELTYVQDFLTLTFGLLDGWWLFEDAEIRLPHSPLLSPEHWQTFYTQMGFEKVSVFGNPSQDLNTHKQCLIVGYNKKQEEKRLVQGEMRKQYYHHQDRRQIINQVTALVAKALDVSPHEISLDDKFSELGIDSILGVELVNDINKALNEHLLSTTTIFDYPTIKELSEYIWTQSSHEVDDFAPYDENRDNQLVTPLVTDIHLENEEQLNNYLETVSVLENNQPSKPLTMDDNEVAIIGMSGQFPGADNLEEFWDNIANGKNAISEIPKSRWDNSQYFDSHFRKPDKAYCKHGGFLADIDKFDPLFFNISPKEAELMDPQQRLFLEHSWKALEDAGYASRQLSGQKVGIYVGMRHSDYLTHILENQQTLDAHVFAGNDSAILAARLAYYLNLKGPSLAIDSACSSSLVAIHLAAHQIRTGQITLAIAGGVLVMTTPQLYTMTLNTGMLSPEGQCKTFDNEANGFVPAEGVGVVVLKSLTEAIKAGDHIYGVIKSSGINQDGKTNGITAPSTLSQTNLELEVYKQASINPETISYVEAHGTGTKLGDPIEVEALTNAYRQYTQNKQFCAIGSVKTNIGHTMFAAGVAGVIKVLLALKHKKIPPSIHFKTPNEHINFKNSPFYVPTQLQDWHTKPDGKRRAAVSAFGFSGTNAHLVIEEYIRNVGNVGWVEQSETHHLPQLIVLSAKNRDRLKASAQQLVDFLVPKSTTMDNTISLQARQEICQYLLTTVSDILKVSDKDINLDEALTDYGFDAMGLTALSHRINDKYQLEITPAIFSEYSSINALVQYLADRFQNQAPVRLKESTQGDNRQKASLSLANVAYTLQVGRFAMEERLAIVVSSLDELTDKLTQYLQDQTALENVYQGNVKTANDATTSLLIEGKSGKAFLKVVTEEKELDKLAQLWVAGVEIDWELLYSNQQKPPRISLPTYPFAKERYWLPENKTAPQGLPAHNIAKLHPLLDSNTSTLQEQKFTTILTGHEFYLVDHIIAGQKVLPGVAYLEMARAAGQIAGERPIQKITNVTWSRPITLSESHVQANISLYPSKPGIVDYEVTTLGKEQQRQVHVQGKLKYADASAQSELSEFIDIETIKARCTQFMTATELYACLKQFGAEFGNSFQVVQEWFGNQTESLSTLKLPSKLKEGWKEFVLHPSLLDGSLQTASVGLFKEAQTLYVPFTIGELEILRPLTENCHVYATLADKKSHGLDSNVKAFNIQITDESGQVLVRIKNFSLRAFRSQTDGTPVEMYYQSVWEKALFTSKTQQLTTYKLVLLFDTDEKRHSVFQEQLKSPVILIKPAHQYQQEGRQSYGINPNHPSDYRQLLASLSQHYKQLPSHIIHLWSQTPFVNKLEALEAQLDLSLYSVFHLSQALLEQKPTEKIQLLYIYLESSEAPQPQYAALSGFAKTIALENSKLVYKTIALPTFTKVMEVVLTEFQIMDSTEIRYQDNQRWRKRWQELDWNRETANKTTLLKENGVYLITGGAGGLGLIFAEYLAKQVKAQLVLSGRSALNDEQATKIQSLNALGASVIYLQADVSKRDQVEALITQTKSHFGHLNGIIHAAGVIRDALILKKPPEEIAIVLAPKVFGTLYLDEATKTEPLDFFVLFSGVAAIVGNVGQCDYTYANCFMDNLAQWREELRTSQKRFGKTLSINWPLWQGGGMQVDEQTEQWFAHTIGMTPLSSKVGLKAFAQGLTLATSQFMVIEGNRQKVKQVLGIDKTVSSQHIPTEIASVTTDNNPLPLTLQQDLLTIASAILKINLKDMGPDDNISEYGFDSISFTELANRINEKYQLELTPAIFFEYPSIGAFSQFLYHEYQEHFLNYYQDSFKTVSITTSPTVSTEDFNIEAPQLKSRFIEVVKSPGEPLVSVEPFINTPIAIIGMSGVMPQSEDLESFWQHLVAGDDLITEVPSDRWDWQAYYGDPFKESNKTQIKWGGFMPAVDKFDAGFFNISAREAELMDPQQRIFLETVWKAIEDAGYKASDLSGTKTGVFAGIASADYSELVKNKSIEIEAYTATGTVFSILANRISYLLNLQGPSESIDTACSSSLIAIHKAVEAIHSGTCDMAIAGGVQAMITPTLTISFSKAGGMLSEDGRCKTFDKSANGYVRGEGVGAILLKPLAQAEADGDNIYAVIKGSAENHGGHATSLTAPNPNAQAQLLINAYEKANIDPSTVSYIEAHGTGTSLGDPIEINGLKNAFADLYKKQGKSLPTEPHCGIGSVKTNIGHLETTAGMAGVFKVLLAMQHKTLPRLLHFKELNPYIHLQETPFYLVTENRPWTPLTDSNGQVIPRRAGVSSFGFGGANAHIVLEEYTRPPRNDINNYAQIIVLSAKNKERLQAYAKQIINFIERVISDNNPTISLTDFAYTLQIGREAMEERLAMVASSLEEVKEKLTQYHQEQTDITNCYQGNVKVNKAQSELLVEGEAGQAFLNIIIEKRELHKLAQLWIAAVNIDWKLLYPNHTLQRISLPTYPFAKERYWVPEPNSKKVIDNQFGPIAKLHPLLDKNTSTLLMQKFTTQLMGHEFYLADHILGNHRVLPGVAYLEMARAAGEIAGERTVYKLTNIIWARPINVPEPTNVEISLTPEQQQIHFEISTLNENQQKQKHCQGNLVYQNGVENYSPEFLDIEAIKARCPKIISTTDLYATLQKWEDVDLKSNFQVIQKLWTNDTEALSRLELLPQRQQDRNEFWLHPLLMDGSVQTAILGILRDIPTVHVHVPFGMGEVEILGDLTNCHYAYATLLADKKQSTKKFNTYLLDETGQVLVRIKDFLVREFQPRTDNAEQGKPEKPNLNEETILISTEAKKEPEQQVTMTPMEVTDKERLLEKLQQDMLSMAATIIKTDKQKIVLDSDLSQYGFESISLTEFANRLNDKYQLAITPALFFEHVSLGAISKSLCEEYQKQLLDYYQGSFKTVFPTTSPVRLETQPVALEQPEFLHRFLNSMKVPSELSTNMPIAIIGMSGMMPQSENLEIFWQHLENGDDLITEVPPDRWDWQSYYGEPTLEANKTKIKWGGFMPAVDEFDPLFFGISPREAELMDPQHRLFLETVWKTIEDAGYKISDLSGTKTGMFVGVATDDYKELLREKGLDLEIYATTGTVHVMVANRVSYLLDLQGPSESINTACSSALVAIHRAVQAIRHEKCEMAIAGGVNVILTPSYTISLGKAGDMLSEDGHCKSFDQSANGYVRSEGVGAILLKPLAQAELDGDTIYAVIKGSAENHGGHATSLTAPNSNAQAQLLINAYEQANLDPTTISYIEAHGTGTRIGDPVEINGLKNAFAQLYKKHGIPSLSTEPHCGVGSVKTNIGHLETASGIAGIFKVVLSMQHHKLPRLLHFKEQNAYIDLQGSPFYLVTENRPWTSLTDNNGQAIPRRAGVSSFGFGGSNAHIILEEYLNPLSPSINSSSQLIVLSAKNEERLKAYAKQLVNFLNQKREHNPLSLADIAYTLQVGREAMEERLAILVSSLDELSEKLTQYSQGQPADFYLGNIKTSKAKSDLLIEGKEGEEFVKTIIHDFRLNKLAQLWVSGIDIDWKLLHSSKNTQPKRISLPTYPFARQRYWIPAHPQNNVANSSWSQVTQSLHPLLDSNESTLEEQYYKKVFYREAFYLKDHVIDGQAILPGVVYLEMARAAGHLAKKKSPMRKLSHIIWAKPIMVSDRPETTYISLYPDSSNQVNFEVSTLDNNQQPQLHAQGKLSNDEQMTLETIDIAAIQARCPEIKARSECYQLFSEIGFHYGPSFQTIETLYCNNIEALSRLVLSAPYQKELNHFILHPSLMDGALQTVSGLPGQITTGLYLPFGLGELIITTECLPEICYAHVTLTETSSITDSQVKKFNIQIVEETGRVLVSMKDFSVRKVQASSNPVATEDNQLLDLLRQLATGKLNTQEVKELM